MDQIELWRCPVCRAKFRGDQTCSRCGADLSRLVVIVEHARQYREKARAAIEERQYETAEGFALKAQSLHDTLMGRRLLWISQWLRRNGSVRIQEPCPPIPVVAEKKAPETDRRPIHPFPDNRPLIPRAGDGLRMIWKICRRIIKIPIRP